MAPETIDANNPVTADGIGVSSSPDAPHIDPDGPNILGTVEDLEGPGESSEETLKTDGTDQEKTGEEKVAGEDDKPLPFHKHPDWQRILKERDEAKQEAEAIKAEIAALKSARESKTEAPRGEEELPEYKGPAFKDITRLTKEELAEWAEEDRVGLEANIRAQHMYEEWAHHQRLRMEEKRERVQAEVQAKIRTTFESYREKNPDFDKMWKSGEIPKFMQANPGHNAISAHQMLTMEARIKEAADKAAKETEAKVLANVKAKRSATVLGAGPGTTGAPPAIDKELSDTKQSGGLTAVLTNRLQKMRKAG